MKAKMPIVGILIFINVIMFVLQMVFGDKFTAMFLLDRSAVLYEPWRLLTSMFLHGSPSHLLFNMYGLYMFGMFLEHRIGRKRFTFLYLASGLFAALAATLLYPLSLGASGALFGVLGAMIMLMPNLRILFFFVFPMTLRTAGIIWILIDVIGLFSGSTGVANLAHLAGVGFGIAYSYKLRQRGQKVRRKVSSSMELTEEDVAEYMRTGRL